MANSNIINSADKWNLNQTYDKIKDMTNSGKFTESIKLAEKGLSMAFQTNDKSWVEKFDDILVDVISQHNQVKSSEPQSNEKAIYNVKVHNKTVGKEKGLTKIKGIGVSVEKKLIDAGIETIDQLASSRPKEIGKIKGLGLNKAIKLISEAQYFLNKTNSGRNSISLSKESNLDDSVKSVSYKKNKQEDMGLVKFLAEKTIKDKNFENQITKKLLVDSKFDDGDNQFIIPELENYEKQKGVKRIIEKDQDNHIFDNNDASFTDENLYREHLDKDIEFDSDCFDYENESTSCMNCNESNDKKSLLGQLDYKKIISKKNKMVHSTDLDYRVDEELGTEKLEKMLIQKNVKNVENDFKSLSYRIIPKKSSLLNGISKIIDILAFKTLEINKELSLIVLFPIKFCNLKGNLIISENSIDYNQYNQNVKVNERMKHLMTDAFIKELNYAQNYVFHSIIREGKLFHYFRKTINERIRVEKTRKNLRLFIRSGHMLFKVVVDPILICQNDPAFLEKAIMFPYQINSNLHIINIKDLTDLIYFLENKYILIENHTDQKNPIISYFKALDKFRVTNRNYSIPFLLFGVMFCFIILVQDLFLIPTFTSLGYAAIGIYAIMLWYSYLRFSKTQRGIIDKYKIPYCENKINLDETELTIIKDDLPPELLNQFIYECIGKNTDFSFTADIEEEKAENLISHFKRNKEIESSNNKEEVDTNNRKNFESSNIRGKIISKYNSFLED